MNACVSLIIVLISTTVFPPYLRYLVTIGTIAVSINVGYILVDSLHPCQRFRRFLRVQRIRLLGRIHQYSPLRWLVHWLESLQAHENLETPRNGLCYRTYSRSLPLLPPSRLAYGVYDVCRVSRPWKRLRRLRFLL